MPTLLNSLEGTIARAVSQLGVRWPNPWWPTGVPAYDDCAAFVSWVLWGLNGRQPFQTIVSGLVEREGLTFHGGNSGIRRGDVLGFRWTITVNYSHTEIALGPPDRNGNVQTIGTNAGPGDNVAIRTRPIKYVHNFARPAYPGFAGGGTTPIQNEENDMSGPAPIHVMEGLMPTPVPAQLLAQNPGLAPGKATYFVFGMGGGVGGSIDAIVTQDQDWIVEICESTWPPLKGDAASALMVKTSLGQLLVWHTEATRARTSGGAVSGPFELGPVSLAALAAVKASIDGLPAQIDQYADGKKQS